MLDFRESPLWRCWRKLKAWRLRRVLPAMRGASSLLAFSSPWASSPSRRSGQYAYPWAGKRPSRMSIGRLTVSPLPGNKLSTDYLAFDQRSDRIRVLRGRMSERRVTEMTSLPIGVANWWRLRRRARIEVPSDELRVLRRQSGAFRKQAAQSRRRPSELCRHHVEVLEGSALQGTIEESLHIAPGDAGVPAEVVRECHGLV